MAGQAGGACVSASEVRGPGGACASASASEGLGVTGSKQGGQAAPATRCGQSGVQGSPRDSHGVATRGTRLYGVCVQAGNGAAKMWRIWIQDRTGVQPWEGPVPEGSGTTLTQHDFHPEESLMHLRHTATTHRNPLAHRRSNVCSVHMAS